MMPTPDNLPAILDATCGARMMWYNKHDSRAVFLDFRAETHTLTDTTRRPGSRVLRICPDVQGDFTNMPFAPRSFALVVFDPPHLTRGGEQGWMVRKYGRLGTDWRDVLRAGFAECWRVLRPAGTLIFKWSEVHIPLSQILPLAPAEPLFGARCGKQALTHWVVFHKPE